MTAPRFILPGDIAGANYSANILDYATSLANRTAIANGSAAFDTAYAAAVADAVSKGYTSIYFPPGNYQQATDSVLLNPGLIIRGATDGKTTLYKNGKGRMFQTLGNLPSAGFSLTADAAAKATSVTLSPSNAASVTAGAYVILKSNNVQSDTRDAEFAYVLSSNGSTGVVTFNRPLRNAYATANSSILCTVSLTRGVGYSDLAVDWTSGVFTSPQRPPYYVDEAFLAWFCYRPTFRNISTTKTFKESISLHGCVDATVDGLYATDGYCDGYDLTDAYAYAIAEIGLNTGLIANRLQVIRMRHGYTTLVADATDATMFNAGGPTQTLISNSFHREAKAAGWDTHGPGSEITFNNVHTFGAISSGFQIRSKRARLIGCSACDIQFLSAGVAGHGLYLVGGDTSQAYARQTFVEGMRIARTAGSAIRDQAPGTVFSGRTLIDETDGPGISADGAASGDGDYSNIYMNDVAKNPVSAQTYAITFGNPSAQKAPRFRSVYVDDPNSNLTAIVRRNDFSTNKVEIDDVKGRNGSLTPIPLYSSTTNNDNTIIRDGHGANALNVGPQKTLTLASDTLNLSGQEAGVYTINPETGSSDTLSSITNGERDSVVQIWGGTGYTFTLTHGTGTDNLYLKGATNATLAQNQGIQFSRRGSVWFENWRSF